MPRVSVSHRAKRDLRGIHAYIAKDSRRHAEAMIDRIVRKFAMLSRQPLIGDLCEEFGENVRRVYVQNYVIYYRPSSQRLRILKVIHGSRDVDAIFDEDPFSA